MLMCQPAFRNRRAASPRLHWLVLVMGIMFGFASEHMNPTAQVAAQEPAAREPAGQENPRITSSVKNGLQFLSGYGFQSRPVSGLVVYTLLSGGEAVDSPAVVRGLQEVEKKFSTDTDFIYRAGPHHLYEAGIDAMALQKADPERFRQHLIAIRDYIVTAQHEHGGWYYPGQAQNNGDTSISQYAVLGLWAVQRAGVEIDERVLTRAVSWLLKTQSADGGFVYHPAASGAGSTGTMTVAGTGTLGVLSLMLYGDSVAASRDSAGPRLKFGILEKVNHADVAVSNTALLRQLQPAIARAIEGGEKWIAERFERDAAADHNGFSYYYFYGVERAAAVNRWEMLGKWNWYTHGADILLPRQQGTGSWPEGAVTNTPSGTCFALLFLMRTTQSIVPQRNPRPALGEGVLAGGRGLPDDLNQVEFRNGKVQSDAHQNELSQLLAGLEGVADADLKPTLPVEKIDLSDPDSLIGQTDQLLRLAKHPDPRVRQVAAWALGRTDRLVDAETLVSLLEDGDLEVAIEARLALCWISRRPTGFGLPADPRVSFGPETPPETQQQQISEWRSAAVRHWKQWYLTQRPYELRDDFDDPAQQKFQRKK